jgi:hypothetical protein
LSMKPRKLCTEIIGFGLLKIALIEGKAYIKVN